MRRTRRISRDFSCHYVYIDKLVVTIHIQNDKSNIYQVSVFTFNIGISYTNDNK